MKNVHSCTFFIDEICDDRKSRFYMEPAASVPLLPVRLSSLLSSCTSVYNCLTTSFSIEKLTTVWNHRRPWQVQKLTSMSIFEREFLLGKNVAAV